MSDINTMRHQSIFDSDEHNPPIHIIGVGATGSRVWLSLVELGLTNIHVYDFDKVEPHNLANQVYMARDVGRPKVHGLARYYQDKTGAPAPEDMGFHNMRVSSETGFNYRQFSGIVFLMTDTMASRRDIYDSIIADQGLDAKQKVFLMIETRMASSYGNVFTHNPFDPAQASAWKATLVDDDAESTEVSPCGTSISVGPTANTIANIAVWQMINFFTDPLAEAQVVNLYMKPTIFTQQGLLS